MKKLIVLIIVLFISFLLIFNFKKEKIIHVGEDIKIGTYYVKPTKKTGETSAFVYKSKEDLESNSYIEDIYPIGFSLVELRDNEYVKLNSVELTPYVVKERLSEEYKDGEYLVGKDIDYGEYTLEDRDSDFDPEVVITKYDNTKEVINSKVFSVSQDDIKVQVKWGKIVKI